MNWIVLVTASIVFAVLGDLLQKEALQHETATEFLVVKAWIIIAAALPLIPYLRLPGSLTTYFLVLLAAGLLTMGKVFGNRAMKHEAISIVEPLFNVQPAFVALLAFLLLKETLTTQQSVGITLIIAGTYWLEVRHGDNIFQPLTRINTSYAGYVIIASLLYAGAVVIDRHLLQTAMDWISYYVLVRLATAVFLTAWQYTTEGLHHVSTVLREQGHRILAPSILGMASILALYGALSTGPAAGLVMALHSVHSVFITIEGGRFFKEKHLWKRTGAGIMTAAGAALVVL